MSKVDELLELIRESSIEMSQRTNEDPVDIDSHARLTDMGYIYTGNSITDDGDAISQYKKEDSYVRIYRSGRVICECPGEYYDTIEMNPSRVWAKIK